MTFAHTTTSTGGPGLEQIALSAGIVLLGLAFLVQKSMDPRVSIALLVLGIVAFVGAFTFLRGGEASITVDGRQVTEGDLEEAVFALCLVRDGAEQVEAADATFQDRAHGPLHDLVTAVEDDDRALAARLLIAKQAVENGLTGTTDPEQLAEDTERLISVTGDALQTVGMEVPEC